MAPQEEVVGPPIREGFLLLEGRLMSAMPRKTLVVLAHVRHSKTVQVKLLQPLHLFLTSSGDQG